MALRKTENSELRGLTPGARVCLASDSSRRGVLEPRVTKTNCWPVRFADKSRNIQVADLKLLPSDTASFEPSQAPLSSKERDREKKASAAETLKRSMSVAVSTDEYAKSL